MLGARSAEPLCAFGQCAEWLRTGCARTLVGGLRGKLLEHLVLSGWAKAREAAEIVSQVGPTSSTARALISNQCNSRAQ
ncbi:hypothetical protein WJX72_001840 [[Myrmecia] bisecta]|uniref:Uncharacterized protein n=1 Tax=[Myrmecia] bisecta TaxID=41462 RepID=A0AAW1QPE0_9CHLO